MGYSGKIHGRKISIHEKRKMVKVLSIIVIDKANLVFLLHLGLSLYQINTLRWIFVIVEADSLKLL